jgi:hypothetical protein
VIIVEVMLTCSLDAVVFKRLSSSILKTVQMLAIFESGNVHEFNNSR